MRAKCEQRRLGSMPNRLFLARLLDALLAGVERALLALGRLDHVLLRLGVCDAFIREDSRTMEILKEENIPALSFSR